MKRKILMSSKISVVSVFILLFLFLLTGCNMEKDIEASFQVAKNSIPLSLEKKGYSLDKVENKKYENNTYYAYRLVLNDDLLNYYILVTKDLSSTFLINENTEIDFTDIEKNYITWEGTYGKSFTEEEDVENCFSNLIIVNNDGRLKLNFDSYFGRGQVKFETLLYLKDDYTTESYYFDTGDSFFLTALEDGSLSITVNVIEKNQTNELTVDFAEKYPEGYTEKDVENFQQEQVNVFSQDEELKLMYSGRFYRT